MEGKIEKINELREKIDNLKSEKERILGKLESQEQRLLDLEKECKEKFSCDIKDLKELSLKTQIDADKLVNEAEIILNSSSNN